MLLCAAGFDRQLAKARSAPVAHGCPGPVDQYWPPSIGRRGPEMRAAQHEPNRIPCFLESLLWASRTLVLYMDRTMVLSRQDVNGGSGRLAD